MSPQKAPFNNLTTSSDNPSFPVSVTNGVAEQDRAAEIEMSVWQSATLVSCANFVPDTVVALQQ